MMAALRNRNAERRVWVFFAFFLLLFCIIWWGQDQWTLQTWIEREAILRHWQQSHPWLLLAIVSTVYLVVSWLAIPGAVLLTVISGWLFGFSTTLMMVSFMSTAGATLAMLTTRYLLADWVRGNWETQIEKMGVVFQGQSALPLLSLRLAPVVPFFMVNIGMGLTKIRPWTFWWVSQLGMLPGTAVYVYFGSSLPSLSKLGREGLSGAIDRRILLALLILGILPWGLRWAALMIKRRYQRRMD